jgi:hypothetical protein
MRKILGKKLAIPITIFVFFLFSLGIFYYFFIPDGSDWQKKNSIPWEISNL